MAIILPILYKSDKAGLDQAEGALAGFKKSVLGIGAAIAGAFSVAAIGNFAKSAMLAAEEAQAVNNVLVQVAKNTLPVTANISAATDRMIKFADSQEVLLGIDGEIIKSTQAKLLGFTNLASSAGQVGGVFDRSLSASFDLAAATGKDVSAMSTALGKALNDPIRGLGGLSKAGIQFSESQREMIEGLVESGDLLGAQEMILGAVEGKFGGAAEAAAKGSERMANAMENLMETAGEPLLGVFADLVTGLQPVLELVGTEIGKAFTDLGPVLTSIVGLLPSLIESFVPMIPIIGELVGLFLEMIVAVLPMFVSLFQQLLPVISELVPILADVFMTALKALMPIFMQLVEALMPIVVALLPVLAQLLVALAPIFLRLIEAVLPLIELLLPIFINLINFLTPVLLAVANILGTILVGAVNLFVGAIEFLTPVLEQFANFFKQLWYGIQSVFVTIINGLISGFENFINSFIDGFNAVIRGVNAVRRALKMDPLELAARVKFGRLDVPELVPLATGGIVMGPTQALIGEAGPEAVIPLSKMGSMGQTYNITVNAGIGTNGAQVGEQIVNAIRKYERTSGPVFARA